MKNILNVKESILNLKSQIATADSYFFEWFMMDNRFKEPSCLIEICFFQLLAISEALELEEFRKMIYAEYATIKNSENGFVESQHDPEGEPYSASLSRIRRYVRSLESFFPKDAPSTSIRLDFLTLAAKENKADNPAALRQQN